MHPSFPILTPIPYLWRNVLSEGLLIRRSRLIGVKKCSLCLKSVRTDFKRRIRRSHFEVGRYRFDESLSLQHAMAIRQSAGSGPLPTGSDLLPTGSDLLPTGSGLLPTGKRSDSTVADFSVVIF